MELAFKDLVTKCWWSWAGLVLFFCLGFLLAVHGGLVPVERGVLALGAYFSLLVFFANPLYRAAFADHSHLLTICIWSAVLVLLGIVVACYSYYAIVGANYLKYDKLLNVIPVFVAIWAAGVGWLVHFKLSNKAHRTSNAFSIIMETRKSGEFLKRQETVTRHFPPGVPVAADYAPYFPTASEKELREKAAQQKKPPDPVALEKIEAIQALKYLLNYYEFMAVGIEKKDLDDDMLFRTISTTVVGTYERAKSLIEYLNGTGAGQGNQKLALVALSGLAEKWRKQLDVETAGR